MKFNSISIKFSDIDNENARMDVVFDPPAAESVVYKPEDFEDQPCVSMASRTLAYLNWLRTSGEGEEIVGPGSNEIIIH